MSTRPVPTNLSGWPGVTDLLPSQKLILFLLWSAPGDLVSVCGVGKPGIIERVTSGARLDEPVVIEALYELDRRGLIVFDIETREVGIRKWVRFHKFTSEKWRVAAEKSYNSILSTRIKSVLVQQEGLKDVFPAKSKAPGPNTNTNCNYNTTTTTTSGPPPPPPPPPPPGGGGGGVEDTEEILQAAAWAAGQNGTKIKNLAGYNTAIRRRLQAGGVSAEDRQALAAWRARAAPGGAPDPVAPGRWLTAAGGVVEVEENGPVRIQTSDGRTSCLPRAVFFNQVEKGEVVITYPSP